MKTVKFYFSGKPCKNGHVSKRYIRGRACVECNLVKDSPKIKAINARKEAKESGQLYYNTGKPCKHGHDSDRLTSNGGCLECAKLLTLKIADTEEGKNSNAKRQMKFYHENKKEISLRVSTKYKNDAEFKERKLNSKKIWFQNNKEHCNAYRSATRRRVRLATPLWSNLNKIKDIYLNCPKGCHVDHIIPLQGELVSGLHIPENLQYLTAEENLKKRNKFEPYIEIIKK